MWFYAFLLLPAQISQQIDKPARYKPLFFGQLALLRQEHGVAPSGPGESDNAVALTVSSLVYPVQA